MEERAIKPKVMIVEDEAISALNLEQCLESWGFEVCSPATTGREAVEKAAAERPDVILMDVTLRGEMNGLEAAREIRTSHAIPIIFLTGYVDEETMKKMREVGQAAFALKPFDFDQLRLMLAQILP